MDINNKLLFRPYKPTLLRCHSVFLFPPRPHGNPFVNYHPMNHLSTSSWQGSSKFREHLSIIVPPHETPVVKSQFSPESPPSLSHNQSTSSNAHSRYHSNKDIESATRTPRSGRSTIKDRFTKFFFDLRTLNREPDMMPIQPRHRPVWPPLHIEKGRCTCHDEKERKRRKWWIIALVILLLYLLADSIFLNASVIALLSDRRHTPGSSIPSTNSTTLSADTQQCISQYELNAPAHPSQYPCSSCLPVLQAIPPTFAFTNAQDAQQVLNAIQFCGLNAIFTEANPDGQSNLSNGGWLNDVRFCAWKGVSCDGSGRVSSL